MQLANAVGMTDIVAQGFNLGNWELGIGKLDNWEIVIIFGSRFLLIVFIYS